MRLVAGVDPIIPGPGKARVAVIGRRGVTAVGIVVIPPAPEAQAEACGDRPTPATPAPSPSPAAAPESRHANAAANHRTPEAAGIADAAAVERSAAKAAA